MLRVHRWLGVGGPAMAGPSAVRAEAALSANARRPARPAFVRIAWNLPSLHDFVHRENANPRIHILA